MHSPVNSPPVLSHPIITQNMLVAARASLCIRLRSVLKTLTCPADLLFHDKKKKKSSTAALPHIHPLASPRSKTPSNTSLQGGPQSPPKPSFPEPLPTWGQHRRGRARPPVKETPRSHLSRPLASMSIYVNRQSEWHLGTEDLGLTARGAGPSPARPSRHAGRRKHTPPVPPAGATDLLPGSPAGAAAAPTR